MPVLPRVKDYDTLYREFRWPVPARYNIGVDVCDRWAQQEPDRLAILHVLPDGRDEPITYGWLRDTSNRLANVLRAHGIVRGDRVAILLPQSPEVAASHIGIYKFGTDALAYRLQNSGAAALITNARGVERIGEIRKDLPNLKLVLSLDGAGQGALGFADALARASSDFTPVDTAADDPAMMVYTSGTTRRRNTPRLLSSARRPHLDAGRLGLGGRSAQCPVARPALWRAGRCAPVREIRSGGSLCADGARPDPQCLYPADRAAHVAGGAQSERPPRHQHALDRLGW